MSSESMTTTIILAGLIPAELQDILGFTTINLARKAGALILEGSHAIQRGPGLGSVGKVKKRGRPCDGV